MRFTILYRTPCIEKTAEAAAAASAPSGAANPAAQTAHTAGGFDRVLGSVRGAGRKGRRAVLQRPGQSLC